jgi:cbb3-type cytochrome oxidase subunit 3
LQLVLTKKEKSMKKIFVMLFLLLLVAFLSTAFNSPGKNAFDKDVGYSLTIDQNIVTISPVQSQVIAGEVSYLIARGVSVPYRGLIISESINIYQNCPACFIDNYNQFWQRSMNMNYRLNPVNGVNTEYQGVTRLDIGETYLMQNIV